MWNSAQGRAVTGSQQRSLYRSDEENDLLVHELKTWLVTSVVIKRGFALVYLDKRKIPKVNTIAYGVIHLLQKKTKSLISVSKFPYGLY